MSDEYPKWLAEHGVVAQSKDEEDALRDGRAEVVLAHRSAEGDTYKIAYKPVKPPEPPPKPPEPEKPAPKEGMVRPARDGGRTYNYKVSKAVETVHRTAKSKPERPSKRRR